MNPYEQAPLLAQYLDFHFGIDETKEFGPRSLAPYPVRCVEECLHREWLSHPASALDLGCAVGGASFELSRFCDEVVGIDYSAQFIETAIRLKEEREITYQQVEEGDLTRERLARIPLGSRPEVIQFKRGDAHSLPLGMGPFDVVLMANLIDRLHSPRICLLQMERMVKPGGQLIITSPYTWLEEYTPKENWLGGFLREGNSVKTLDSLKAILSDAFQFVEKKEIPFLIREHARKYQRSVAEASLWRRR